MENTFAIVNGIAFMLGSAVIGTVLILLVAFVWVKYTPSPARRLLTGYFSPFVWYRTVKIQRLSAKFFHVELCAPDMKVSLMYTSGRRHLTVRQAANGVRLHRMEMVLPQVLPPSVQASFLEQLRFLTHEYGGSVSFVKGRYRWNSPCGQPQACINTLLYTISQHKPVLPAKNYGFASAYTRLDQGTGHGQTGWYN